MKDKLNITLDKEVKEEFTRLCDKLAIKRSKWLENKIKEFIQENKNM